MEIIQVIRTTPSQSKSIRRFKSGMVGVAKGQVVRINVVSTATPEIGSKPNSHISYGLWANPRSELLAQETVSLEPGASAFLDVDWDALKAGKDSRHQVRAEVIVRDDADGACAVTLEVFDKDTGKTTVFMEVKDAADPPLP